MAYSHAKLDETKAAAEAGGPCVIEEIQAHSSWKAPAFLSCTSGVLLWGQLSTVMHGYLEKEEEVDTELGPYQTSRPCLDRPSFILQSFFRHRAQARKGLWKVEAAFYAGCTHLLGYVCHHVDAHGPDLLRRAALVGVSLQNDHEDQDIVYVNRYDWAEMGSPSAGYELIRGLLKLDKKPKEEKISKEPKEKKNSLGNPKPVKVKSTYQNGLHYDDEILV